MKKGEAFFFHWYIGRGVDGKR